MIIAHRLSTIEGADRIVYLEDGGVEEVGSHEDLIARGGKYSDLWAERSGAEDGGSTERSSHEQTVWFDRRMDEAAADPVKPPRKRRWPRWVAGIAVLGAVVYAGSIVWISVASAGHTSDAVDAPDAPVVIVLGAQIKDGKPMAFLKGRLDAAVELVEAGKAKAVLVSGDANGGSGDEIAAMTNYLLEQGIDERRIVGGSVRPRHL